MSTVEDVVLKAEPLRYYSRNDEAAFFEWLDKLPCVTSYTGRGRALNITVNTAAVDDEGFRDLFALFRRYDLDHDQLRRLAPVRFRSWFDHQAHDGAAAFN